VRNSHFNLSELRRLPELLQHQNCSSARYAADYDVQITACYPGNSEYHKPRDHADYGSRNNLRYALGQH
jgi:hypothetical protein